MKKFQNSQRILKGTINCYSIYIVNNISNNHTTKGLLTITKLRIKVKKYIVEHFYKNFTDII